MDSSFCTRPKLHHSSQNQSKERAEVDGCTVSRSVVHVIPVVFEVVVRICGTGGSYFFLGKKKILNFDRFQEAVRKMAQTKGITYTKFIQQACKYTQGIESGVEETDGNGGGGGGDGGGVDGKQPKKKGISAFEFASYGY